MNDALAHFAPVTLELNGVRLEPLGPQHAAGLLAAASDGQLWKLRITSVPEPDQVDAYIATALEMRPGRYAFAVIDSVSEEVIGTTSYHDIVPALDRVEIGYTWYARSRQRSYVNTSCKLMLLTHAFETLGCAVVGFRTDNFNHASQAAIARLGAKRTACCATMRCGATAPCATPSCTASCAANGRKSRRTCATS